MESGSPTARPHMARRLGVRSTVDASAGSRSPRSAESVQPLDASGEPDVKPSRSRSTVFSEPTPAAGAEDAGGYARLSTYERDTRSDSLLTWIPALRRCATRGGSSPPGHQFGCNLANRVRLHVPAVVGSPRGGRALHGILSATLSESRRSRLTLPDPPTDLMSVWAMGM